MTDNAKNAPTVTVEKIEAQQFQHARTDTKTATRWAILVDGVKIGEVGSHSEESWATSGRLRTRKLGYNRNWLGALETNPNKSMISGYRRADAISSTRAGCIERLVEKYLASR